MSFKIGVFKILQYPQEFLQKKKKFTGKHLCWSFTGLLLQNTYGELFWVFAATITFFQLNLAFIADSRTGFSPNLFENTS